MKTKEQVLAERYILHAFWYLFYTRKGKMYRIAAEDEILSRAWLQVLHPEKEL